MKSTLNKLAHGDVSGLVKAGQKVAAAAKVATTRLVQGDVDAQMRAAHDRCVELHTTFSALYAALKHRVERARKTAKTLRESGEPMLSLVGTLDATERRQVQSALASDSAIASRWEEYCGFCEKDLLEPAKRECSAIFAESEALWSQYLSTVNELGARKGKERLVGSKNSSGTDASPIAALEERKAAHESEKPAQLATLAEAAQRTMAFLVAHERRLHSSILREAAAAAATAAGEAGNTPEDMQAVIAACRAGWSELWSASSSLGLSARYASGAAAPPPPSHNSNFGVPLETLALRTDAIGGVPWLMHALGTRLLRGGVSADGSWSSFLDTEGIFRLSAEADDCDALRTHLSSGGSVATAQAAVDATNDPHVLATLLKEWLRRLPSPLVPSSVFNGLVALGTEAMSAANGSAQEAALIDGIASLLTPSLPQPNLLTLHALVELLEAVASRGATNRMGATNLAVIFAPSIGRSEGLQRATSMEVAAVEIPAAARVLTAMISERSRVFPPLPSILALSPPPDLTDHATAGGTDTDAGDTARWWYSAASGEQLGPVTGARLAAMLATGEVSMATWVFESGMEDWQELSKAQARLPTVVAPL